MTMNLFSEKNKDIGTEESRIVLRFIETENPDVAQVSVISTINNPLCKIKWIEIDNFCEDLQTVINKYDKS